MTRTQWILAGLLVLQVALLALVAPWSRGAGAAEPRPLVPALEADKVSRVEVADSTGQTVELVRTEGTWRLPSADDYPADGAKVDELLRTLGGVRVRRPVVSSARYHATLKVTEKEHERRIRVFAAGSTDPVLDLLVGSSPSYGVQNVRLAAEDAVYEARGLQPYELRPEAGAWITGPLLGVSADDVTALVLRNAHGEVRLEKQDGAWTLAPGGAADPGKADSLVRSLAGFAAQAPAGRAQRAEFGFASPAASFELTWTAQDKTESAVVELGAEVPGSDGDRYARRRGASHAAIVSSWDAKRVVDEKAADLGAGK